MRKTIVYKWALCINWKILFEEITRKCDIVEKHRVHTLKMPRYWLFENPSHLDWIRRDKALHGRTDLYVLEMHYTADKPLCRWGKYSPDPVYQVMKSKYEMYTMPIANYIMTLTRAAAIIRCWNLRRKFPGEADPMSIGIMHDKRSW